MALKTRHIEQNMKQINKYMQTRTLKPDMKYLDKWDKTVSKVHWETNSLVKRHPHIDPTKIIPKSSTSEFPANAITVRFHSQKRKYIGVYVYGEKKMRTWGNGQSSYTYVDSKLKVDLPTKGYNGREFGYSFQGELPSNMDMEGLGIALNYISDTVKEINRECPFR